MTEGLDSETIANISTEFLEYQYHVLGITQFLSDPSVTEICINRPGEVFLETIKGWQRIEVPSLSFDRARQFCTTVVNESKTGQRITSVDPVVSLTFPTGQRAQFVLPPAVPADHVSITIRLPSRYTKTLEQYRQDGFFAQILEDTTGVSAMDEELLALKQARDYHGFFSKAVHYKKNIVVSGATGSGKTTFMKSLVTHIPDDERLITIEDARELFIEQPNRVHLIYSRGGQG
ncbi:MAG: P-type DNA transfer ATPase VirB11, partial [Hydrogenophaga sp.]|nr:P-type DNA transfer ATPase VirB11 [Hydrogenophaga sp.]